MNVKVFVSLWVKEFIIGCACIWLQMHVCIHSTLCLKGIVDYFELKWDRDT